MMKKLILILTVCTAALGLFPLTASAGCGPGVPDEIYVGDTYCIQMARNSPCTFNLVGSDTSWAAYPILILQTGCNHLSTDCDVTCTPIVPPTSFVLGGDTFEDSAYFGESDCLQIHITWNHDGTWLVDIWSTCAGCFCLTFDRQLPVELLTFAAEGGPGSINISWQTASEADNMGWSVQRSESADGPYAEQTRLESESSPTGSSYFWTDNNVQMGTTYFYRLGTVDIQGNIVLQDPIRSASALDPNSSVPASYALRQNYPNPFNPSTTFEFDVAQAGHVSLKIYDLLGQEVATVVNGNLAASTYRLNWRADNLATGMYVYRLVAGNFSASKKLVLIK